MHQNLKSKLTSLLKRTYKYAAFAVLALSVIGAYWFYSQKPQETKAGWWNEQWSYRKAITINHRKVAGDLTNFPMLVSLTDANLGTHAQADGDDIVFIAQNGEKLKHEIESFATTTGVLVVWVKMPTMFETADQTIYMYYGNAGAGNQEAATEVWDENYVGVWHLTDEQNSSTTDSTKFVNNGDAKDNASSTAGKLANALVLDGNYDYIEFINNSASLDFIASNTYAWSAWVKYTFSTTSKQCYLSKDIAVPKTIGFNLCLSDASGSADLLVCKGQSPGNDLTCGTSTNSNFVINEWSNVAVVYKGNYSWDIYQNGGFIESIDFAVSSDTISKYFIGAGVDTSGGGVFQSPEHFFFGNIDEVRVSNSSRSAAWIQTEYNNQSNPASFLSVQAEETGPGPVGYWSFDDPSISSGQGGVIDHSGQGNHGTNYGAIQQDESMCVSGKCLYFDGTDDCVNAGTSSVHDMEDYMTITAWVYPINWGQGGWGTIVSRNSATYGYQFEIGEYLENHFNETFLIWNGNNGQTHANDYSIKLNSWNHVAVVINNDVAYFYLNGFYINNDSWDLTESGLGSLYIGCDIPESNTFEGRIDEVKIYPYARTADQIRQDYAAGLAGIGSSHGVAAAFGLKSNSWMSDGLVGYWKFDETVGTYDSDSNYDDAIDTSGSGYAGSAVGNASTTAGKFGNSGTFDGNGDYINLASDFIGVNTVTVCAWMKTKTLSSWQSIVGNDQLIFGPYASGNLLILTSDSGTIGAIYSADNSLSTDTWYHACGVRLSDGSGTIYINGIQSGDSGFTGTPSSTFAPSIGSWRAGNGTLPFNGSIDEVRIYNRALSSAEVSALYEWAPGPVAWWKMDEKSGTTTYDVSGNEHQGALGGGNPSQYPSWQRGKFGSALQFSDDINSYVAVDDHTDFRMTGGFSVAAWVKRTGQLGDWSGIAGKGIANESEWEFGYDGNTSNNIFFMVNPGDASDADRYYKDGVTQITDTDWHHLAATYDGSNVRLFVDGILDATHDITAYEPPYVSTAEAGLGMFPGFGTSYVLDGSIDDVRIYNYARTQKQILEDMNGGEPGANGHSRLHPVLELKFDEGKGGTSYDSSGYKNNGTLFPGTTGTNAATSAMWDLNGKFGKAIEFDGTNDKIEVPDNNSLDMTDAMTMSAWVYLKGDPSTDGTIVVKEDDTHTAAVYYLFTQEVNNAPYAEIGGSGGFGFNKTLSANRWYHLAVTCANDIMSSYVDGEVDRTVSDSGCSNISTSNQALTIGGNNVSGWGDYFNGFLDEVKVYNYALTAVEVKTDYNRGMATVMGSIGRAGSSDPAATSSNAQSLEYCVPGSADYCAPPVGEWTFNEKTGTTTYDTSGNGNNGYFVSAGTSPTWKGSGYCKSGNCLSFDGSNDYVQFSNDMMGDATGTITAWIYPKSYGGGGNYGNIFNNISTIFSMDGVRGGLLFTSDSGITEKYSESVYLNQWMHVAVSRTSVGEATIYVNGAISGTANEYSGLPLPGVGPQIGDDLGTGFNNFDGLIDDFKIYNYARTPAQIAYEFNGGKPIAHWRFDECQGGTIADSAVSWNPSAGSGQAGTLYLGNSGVTATGTCASSSNSFWYNGRMGKYNSAANFDGTDDYVSVLSSNALIPTEVSISAWFKADTLDNNFQSITAKYDVTLSNGYGLAIFEGDDANHPNELYFAVSSGGPDHMVYGSRMLTGRWYHAVGTFNNSTAKLYIDGKFIDEKTSASMGSTADSVTIGNFFSVMPFDGLIDEVKIWNYALTLEQVKTEYSGGAVRFGQ